MRDRRIGSFLALAAFGFSAVARAQTAGQPGTAQGQRMAAARDVSGVWVEKSGSKTDALLTSTNQEPPMTPWAEARFNSARPESSKIPTANTNDPHFKCDPEGVSRAYLTTQPMEIIETPTRVFIFYQEGHAWREVWVDGRPLPKDPDLSYLGYSVGRWEGDTLVIDTIGLNDKTWLDNAGHPHSEDLHVVERLRRLNHDTLQVTFTFEDPKAYTKTWTTAPRIFKLNPNLELEESFCVPDDNFKAAGFPVAPSP